MGTTQEDDVEGTKGSTPRPWICLGLGDGREDEPIYSSDTQQRPVATAHHWDDYDWNALANAAFIVRACNAHDDLLAACKALVALDYRHVSDPRLAAVIRQTESAIEKATGD